MSTTAFVFPGQGSQSVGMLQDLASHYSMVTDTFANVSETLGFDVWDLVQNGPAETLNQTEHTQVAMLVADVAIYRLIQSLNPTKACMMAGHSLGEYAALVAAGALKLTDAAKLVQRRGQLMQDAVPLGLGAMAAIVGLTDEEVQSLCINASHGEEQVTPANYNAIGQVVIAGHASAIDRALTLAEGLDARLAKKIPVSVPCHCPLLMSASELFKDALEEIDFKPPLLPVISNVDLSFYQSPKNIRALLIEQLYRPVRWVETIQLMKNNGVQTLIECGPGKVLSGLVKRIDKSIEVISVCDKPSLELYVARGQKD